MQLAHTTGPAADVNFNWLHVPHDAEEHMTLRDRDTLRQHTQHCTSAFPREAAGRKALPLAGRACGVDGPGPPAATSPSRCLNACITAVPVTRSLCRSHGRLRFSSTLWPALVKGGSRCSSLGRQPQI